MSRQMVQQLRIPPVDGAAEAIEQDQRDTTSRTEA